MPKNKKPAPFMVFVMEYKKQYPNMTLETAISQAGTEWQKMSEQEKSHYKNRSKTESTGLHNNPREKYTSQGVPVSYLEKQKNDAEREEQLMKKEIKDLILAGRNSNSLTSENFYFITANYFVRNADGSHYIPAEIALCEFSLQYGITNKYHSFVNPPEKELYGHAYEAVEHAKNTHNLPLPPNAFGEKNLSKLYSEILQFIQSKNDNIKEIPPLYTIDSQLPVLKSILNYLQKDEVAEIRIYSLHYLFYFLKKTTSEIGQTIQVDSIHITNAILDRDFYEYQSGISCEYHEKIDKTKYCALSYVIRWAYTFSDNMCMDLGITLKPGVHISLDADLSITNTHEEPDINDTESTCSNNSWNRNATESKIRSSLCNNSSFSITGEHFPKLNINGMSKNKITEKNTNDSMDDINNTLNETVNGIKNIEIEEDNPWLSRFENKPREPKEDSFNFVNFPSVGRGINLSSQTDDSHSESSMIISRARGRGLLLDSSSTTSHTSFGRGRILE